MEVSSEKWREASIHGIKLAQTIIKRSDMAVDDKRLTDPLPVLRDVCIKQSNDRIRTYMRVARAVVAKLRRSYIATNNEMKSLNRCKENLEKALEHKRKDLVLNRESQEMRTYRPLREKETDCADKLLLSEQSHLISLKWSLEAQLSKVQVQLQELNMVKVRLAAAIQERARVTDLLCQSMSSINSNQTPRETVKRPSSSTSSRKSLSLHQGQDDVLGSQSSVRIARGHSKAYSAPVPLELGVELDLPVKEDSESTLDAGPFDAFSAEVSQATSLSSESILKSRALRKEVASIIDHTDRMQQAAHASVNEGLTRKIAQTVTLTEHLEVSSGETKLAVQRSQRHYNAQQKALGYLLGPVSYMDITARERLDRPVVKAYQRHVGTDLPEAAHLIHATDKYRESMDATMRNIGLLKLADKGLKEDVKDKKTASFLDSNVVRLRRRKANHRWVLHGKSYNPKPKTKIK